MHNKIVENWLTKVGELTFTIPFCQLLLSKGYRIVHISSQGPMEQGKDVIAVDKDRRVHCYQLKSGNINNKVWGEIRPEIDDLVELPPKHPSLSGKIEEWDAYLVTNGTIANPTARTIQDYADAKVDKGYRPIKTIVRGQLVQDFIEHFGDFMPIEIQDLQQFLNLYNEDGEHDLPCERFKQYFESYFSGHSAESRQKKTEAVRAALILCTYLLTYKYAVGNRIEIIKAYALLLGSIYHYTESNGLDEKLWRDTELLIYEAIEIEFRQLIDELTVHEADFVESKHGVLSETIAYKLRCNEILGYLAAYLNYCFLRRIEPYQPAAIEATLNKAKSSIALVGECTIPFLTNYGLNAYAEGNAQEAASTWIGTLVAILKANAEGALGLPSPYYNMPQAIEWALGIGGRLTGESFQFRSYCLRSIVLLLARTGQRNVLSTAWRPISIISQSEIIPDTRADYLMWAIPTGPQSDQFPDTPQSWAKLVAESTADYSDDLPLALRTKPYFLPFLINVMPHRFNHRFVLTLFTALDNTSN